MGQGTIETKTKIMESYVSYVFFAIIGYKQSAIHKSKVFFTYESNKKKIIQFLWFVFLFDFKKEALRVIQPIWIGYLIDYFSGQTDLQTALIYGSLVCLISFLNGMLNHMNFQQTQRYGMRMRIAVCGLIYRKV